MPNSALLHARWNAWEKSRVMASEMECSGLFIVSSIRGARAGAIMAYGEMNDKVIKTACDAIKVLIDRDKASE